MSERTPLRQRDEENGEEYEEFQLSHNAKVTLGAVASLLGLGCLYFFTVFLPAYFIPQATDLYAIPRLSSLDIKFEPLSRDRVIQLGLNHFVDYNEAEEETETEQQQQDDEEIPTISSTGSKSVERLILIGDIHGHYKELKKLLKKVNYSSKRDHLLVLGDFITKGPESFKVLDYLIENKIDCILGNHEYYVLQNYAKFHGLDSPSFANSTASRDFIIDDKFNEDPEWLLSRKLQPHHVQYINKCSVIKNLGQMPKHKWTNNGSFKSADGYAVHAGLRWDLDLDNQNPLENLEMRSYIGPYYNETTDDPEDTNSLSWSKYFNKIQKDKPFGEGVVVYYGHDARRGLKLRKFTKGLDTGCDKGDQLTAMVIWNEVSKNGKGAERILYKEQPVQVDC